MSSRCVLVGTAGLAPQVDLKAFLAVASTELARDVSAPAAASGAPDSEIAAAAATFATAAALGGSSGRSARDGAVSVEQRVSDAPRRLPTRSGGGVKALSPHTPHCRRRLWRAVVISDDRSLYLR